MHTTRVYEGEEHDFVLEWVLGRGDARLASLDRCRDLSRVTPRPHHRTAADLQAVAHPALRHRIVTNSHAAGNGVTPDRVIDCLVAETPERDPGDEQPSPPRTSSAD